MLERTSVSKWKVEYNCYSCKNKLTEDELMNSRGVCPHCGEVDEGSTIVKYTKYSYRMILTKWIDSKFPFYHSKIEIQEKGE